MGERCDEPELKGPFPMNPQSPSAIGDDSRIEERLRSVTALCVESLLTSGLDARTIRRTVLGIATRAITSLAEDSYEEETHTAVVQRTIDEMLSHVGRIP